MSGARATAVGITIIVAAALLIGVLSWHPWAK
jgi:hypothetical protein